LVLFVLFNNLAIKKIFISIKALGLLTLKCLFLISIIFLILVITY